jgi:hypothetical protein
MKLETLSGPQLNYRTFEPQKSTVAVRARRANQRHPSPNRCPTTPIKDDVSIRFVEIRDRLGSRYMDLGGDGGRGALGVWGPRGAVSNFQRQAVASQGRHNDGSPSLGITLTAI